MIKFEEVKENRIRTILKFIVFLFFTIGIPFIVWLTNRELFLNFKNVEDCSEYLLGFGNKTIFMYLLIQFIQVVIAFIPGQILEMSSGYLYGLLFGCLITLIGLLIGTIFDYFFAKILGTDFIHLVIPEKEVIKYMDMLNSKKGIIICFLLYLIPGFPKDMVSYIAGLSGIDFKLFIIVSTIGRSPGLIGAVAMGALLKNDNVIGFIIIGVIAVIGFFSAFIFKKQINDYIDKLKIGDRYKTK